MDTFLSALWSYFYFSSPFSCQSFKCMLKYYTLPFPHYSRVLPVTRFPKFPLLPLLPSSNPGSYQSITADTSHFLSEAHLLSNAGDTGLIPDRRTKIPCTTRCGHKKKKKKRKEREQDGTMEEESLDHDADKTKSLPIQWGAKITH